jgi:hypothetical protein
MRRTIMKFAASASLVLSVAGLASAGQFTPAAATTLARPAATDVTTYSIASSTSEPIQWFLYGHGVGKLVSVSRLAASTFEITGRTGKWLEFKDTGNGDCLDLVGSVSRGFHVNEENCNDRSAELWWLVSGIANPTQIQNQYGTKLLKHDACMWNAEANKPAAADITVVKCKASQPPAQVWNLES